MALYMIGDVQGCHIALQQLLEKLDFSPSRDTAYLLGDLVNRGPDSLGVLRWAMAAGTSARCILGNHDLHLLGVAQGVRKPGRQDTLDEVLGARDAPALLHWLRQQPLARLEHGWLMVHAGVLPQWSIEKTMALSEELSSAIAGFEHENFFQAMYGNQPDQWDETLHGHDRLRVVLNALTRLRFCTAEGRMEFDSKDDLGSQPPGYMPWFDVPGRLTAQHPVAFGHWSTLQGLQRPHLLALDTGCVWGGCLTAARLVPSVHGKTPAAMALERVPCARAQTPGPTGTLTQPWQAPPVA
jgi:bis(5'-nucleosyl)-tetraphosphatase (symmetrical)